MARARNIKPGFFMNEALVELPFEARLLFIGLWTLADREGRLEDRPKRIKMELFPADEVDVAKCLSMLEEVNLVKRYVANGVDVVWVRNFKKHQSPHHTERASVLPDEFGAYIGEKPATLVAKKVLDRSNTEDVCSAGGVNNGDKHVMNGEFTDKCKVADGEYRADLLIPDSLNTDVLNEDCGLRSRTHKGEGEVVEARERFDQQEVGKKRTRLPKLFALRDVDVVFAQERGVNAEVELEVFRCYHQAKGSLMLDWYAAWRAWCLNSVRYGKTAVAAKGAAKGAVNGIAHAGQDKVLKRGRVEGVKDYGKGVRANGTIAF